MIIPVLCPPRQRGCDASSDRLHCAAPLQPLISHEASTSPPPLASLLSAPLTLQSTSSNMVSRSHSSHTAPVLASTSTPSRLTAHHRPRRDTSHHTTLLSLTHPNPFSPLSSSLPLSLHLSPEGAPLPEAQPPRHSSNLLSHCSHSSVIPVCRSGIYGEVLSCDCYFNLSLIHI